MIQGDNTITAWFQLSKEGTEDTQIIIGKGSGQESYIFLGIDGAKRVPYLLFFFPGCHTLFGNTPVVDGEWHHIAGTYDLTAMRVYVDGVLDSELADTKKFKKNIEELAIGAKSGGSSPVKGIIDEVGVFNRALTADEINNIMKNGLRRATGPKAILNKDKVSTTWGSIKHFSLER